MKLGNVLLACGSILTGCSTTSHGMKFDGNSAAAFTMIAYDSGDTSFGFKRVDLAKSMFLSDSFELTFGGKVSIDGNEFKNPEQANSALHFAGRLVKPGDYVLVYRLNSALFRGITLIDVNCYSLGAVVYRFKAGEINLAPFIEKRSAGGIDRTAIESEAKLLLQDYPGISAPMSFAEVVGIGTFKSPPEHAGKKSCGAGSFSIKTLNSKSKIAS